MSFAGGAQAIDLAQPAPFEGFDVTLCEWEGLIQESCAGGDINFPWLIAESAMIGNAATVGMFLNPRYYDSEMGTDATGLGSGMNYSGAGGRQAVGGSTIWW